MYLVKDTDYSDNIIVGVFTTKRKALIGVCEYMIIEVEDMCKRNLSEYIEEDCILSDEFEILKLNINEHHHSEIGNMVKDTFDISDEDFSSGMKNGKLLRYLKIEELLT